MPKTRAADEITKLGADFWEWRRTQAPVTRDDIVRIDRPKGWLPDWSLEAVARYRRDVETFVTRMSQVELPHEGVGVRVDAELLSSAISRARWELDELATWERDPSFYVDQSIGAAFLLMLPLDPFTLDSVNELILRLENVPAMLLTGQRNLYDRAYSEFSTITQRELQSVELMVAQSRDHFVRCIEESDLARRATGAFDGAGAALGEFRDWLESAPTRPFEPLGSERFVRFTREVALLPFAPDELLAIGAAEWSRSVCFEAMECASLLPEQSPSVVAESARQQCEVEERLEREMADFYESHALLSAHSDSVRYLNAPMPGYLAPLSWLGVTDCLTDGEESSGVHDVSYVPEPCGSLPYFHAANAQDPRLGIAHEGAHSRQLARSQGNTNPLRRHYYDSCANEGIAFYNEELLLQAGLWSQAPRSRAIQWNMIRLRALRVELDVGLALGNLTIDDAAAALAKRVPMDDATARSEAVMFASTPGLGMAYVIGKHQIVNLVAEVSLALGDEFSLRDMHDYLWYNGNVPVSLMRQELLSSEGQELLKQWSKIKQPSPAARPSMG